MRAWLKLNEIRSFIKIGIFNIGVIFERAEEGIAIKIMGRRNLKVFTKI
jgi:hypothetical protein